MTQLAERIARIAEEVSPYVSRHFLDLDDYQVLTSTANQTETEAGGPPRKSSVRWGAIGLIVFLSVIATVVPADLTSGALERATPISARPADDIAGDMVRPADDGAWTDTLSQFKRLLAQQNRATQNPARQAADTQLLNRLAGWLDKGAR